MTKSKQYSGYDIDVEISGIERVGGKGAAFGYYQESAYEEFNPDR